MNHKKLTRRIVAGAAVVAAVVLGIAGVFVVMVPAAAGQEGGDSGCIFPDNLQSEQALELTSATTGDMAAVVLADGQFARCFSGGNDTGYRQLPLQVELVQRRGGPSGLETIDSELSQLRCLEENDLCLPLSEGVGTMAQPVPGCPALLASPGSQPEDTVAATTFTLDSTLVATIQVTKAVHFCGAGPANVYLFHEVVQERRKRRDGDALVTIGRSVDGIACFLDAFNAVVTSCKRFDPGL